MILQRNAGTFQRDLELPQIKLPKLRDVINYYLDIIFPILSTSVFFNYKSTIDQLFVNEISNIELKFRCTTHNLRNTVEEWRLYGYNFQKESETVPFTSIAAVSSLHFPENNLDIEKSYWPPDSNSQIERTAIYLRAVLIFWLCLRQEVVLPEQSEERNGMLSMNGFRNLFNSSRLPDKYHTFVSNFKTQCEGEVSSAVLFCVDGYVCEVDFFEGGCGLLPLDRMISLIKQIVSENKASVKNVIGVTTLDKCGFNSAMKFYLKSDIMLKKIQNSILWVALDSYCPTEKNYLFSLLTSSFENRCGIKSLSLNVFKNGIVGFIADSGVVDPELLIKLIQFIDSQIICQFSDKDYPIETRNLKFSACCNEAPYTSLHVNLPPELDMMLTSASYRFKRNTQSLDISSQNYVWFNQRLAEKWNVDPRITVHLLILLTYYEIRRGQLLPSCMVISQRRFYRGRIDLVPTGFIEVYTWLQSCHDKKCHPQKLRGLFLLAHKRLHKETLLVERLGCGPVTYLNALYVNFKDSSPALNQLCSSSLWRQSGFDNYGTYFPIQTYYFASSSHFWMTPAIPYQNSTVFSYTVTETSTLLTVLHRSSFSVYHNFISPKYFLKEFLVSIELLNQMFD